MELPVEYVYIQTPNAFSGIYGIGVHCSDQSKVEEFREHILKSMPSNFQPFLQGSRTGSPTTNWCFFEFWCDMNLNQRQDLLLLVAEVISRKLQLSLHIL